MLLLADRSNKMWRLARYFVDSLFRTRRIQIFVITYLAYATLYATRKPFSVVKTDVQQDLGIDTDWLGAIDTCFLAAYAAGQLLIPTLLSQYPTLSASLVLFCLYGGSGLTSLSFGMVASPTAFCALWTANGLLHAAVFPLLITCLTPWFGSNERGKVMGAWTTSQQVGAIAATAMSAWMAAHLGWRAAFTIPGIFTSVFGVFLAWAMRGTLADGSSNHQSPLPAEEDEEDVEMVQQIRQSPAAALAAGALYHSNPVHGATGSVVLSLGAEGRSARDLRHVYDTPSPPPLKPVLDDQLDATMDPALMCGATPNTIRRLSQITDVKSVSCSYFCVKCIRYSLLFWLPYYLATELNYPHEIAGYTSIIFDVGGVLGGIGAGQIADRLFSGRRIYVAALACALGTLSLVAFSLFAGQSKLMALTLLAAIGIAIAAADSIIGGSAASDICERAKFSGSAVGAISGVINGCGSVGAVLQGYMTSKLTQSVGWPWFYMILASVAAVGGTFLCVPAMHEKAAVRVAGAVGG